MAACFEASSFWLPLKRRKSVIANNSREGINNRVAWLRLWGVGSSCGANVELLIHHHLLHYDHHLGISLLVAMFVPAAQIIRRYILLNMRFNKFRI